MRCVKSTLYIALILLFFTPTYGLVIKSGDEVVVGEGEVIDDDLVAFAQEVDIRGRVRGDVYAFAQDVTVGGEIDGTIITGARDIAITTTHARTVWAAGGEVDICGNVSNNVIMVGGRLSVCDDARIGKELRAYGGKLALRGTVTGMTHGGVGTFVMSGSSGGIQLAAEEVKLQSGATVLGDFAVKSEKEPEIDDGVVITGETILDITEEMEEVEEAKSALVAFIAFFVAFIRIIIFITMVIVGIILIAISQTFVRRIMDTLIQKPWQSLGWGFLGLIAIPVAVVILFVVMIGFPLAVFGLYVYTIICYLSSVVVALVLGEKIIQLFKKKGEISLYVSFIIGIVILFFVSLVPILNVIAKLIVTLFGAGALLAGCWQLFKDMRAKKLV